MHFLPNLVQVSFPLLCSIPATLGEIRFVHTVQYTTKTTNTTTSYHPFPRTTAMTKETKQVLKTMNMTSISQIFSVSQ